MQYEHLIGSVVLDCQWLHVPSLQLSPLQPTSHEQVSGARGVPCSQLDVDTNCNIYKRHMWKLRNIGILLVGHWKERKTRKPGTGIGDPKPKGGTRDGHLGPRTTNQGGRDSKGFPFWVGTGGISSTLGWFLQPPFFLTQFWFYLGFNRFSLKHFWEGFHFFFPLNWWNRVTGIFK